MKIREYIGISSKTQGKISRFMQLLLAAGVLGGFYLGNTGIIVNSAVSLAISFLPPILQRDHDLVIDPALVLWMTSAVFFHAAGTYGPYKSLWWWDHFTHMLSSSVVAAAGYTAVRALENHHEGINLPRKFVFVFLLVFVMAFGVIWELLEFGISGTAEILGGETVLTQYDLEDTMKDLTFDTLGGIFVALVGETYLTDLSEQLRQKFEQ